MIGNLTKVNHRYRGPQESKKLLMFQKQVEFNIKKLKDTVDALEDKTNLKEYIDKTEENGAKHKILSAYDSVKKSIEIMEDRCYEQKYSNK